MEFRLPEALNDLYLPDEDKLVGELLALARTNPGQEQAITDNARLLVEADGLEEIEHQVGLFFTQNLFNLCCEF